MQIKDCFIRILFAGLFVATAEARVYAQSESVSADDTTSVASQDVAIYSRLLTDLRIQRELALDNKQLEQLREHFREFQRALSVTRSRSYNTKGEPENAELESRKQLSNVLLQQIQKILLPVQYTRLNEIVIQSKIKVLGKPAILLDRRVAESLGIDETQRLRIQQRSKKIKEQLEKKISQMREEAEKELLSELTPKQRQELESMIGEKFALDRSRRD